MPNDKTGPGGPRPLIAGAPQLVRVAPEVAIMAERLDSLVSATRDICAGLGQISTILLGVERVLGDIAERMEVKR